MRYMRLIKISAALDVFLQDLGWRVWVFQRVAVTEKYDLGPQKVAQSKGNPRKLQENLGWWNIIPFGQNGMCA